MSKAVHVAAKDPRANIRQSDRMPTDRHIVVVMKGGEKGYEYWEGQVTEMLSLESPNEPGKMMYKVLDEGDQAGIRGDGRNTVLECSHADFASLQAAMKEYGERQITVRQTEDDFDSGSDRGEYVRQKKAVKLSQLVPRESPLGPRKKEPVA